MNPARILIIIAAISVALFPRNAGAQALRFDAWFEDRVAVVLEQARIRENAGGFSRQREISLVDQSSASDFLSTAVGVIYYETNPTASGSVSASLYSLMAVARGKALTDPQFYQEQSDARRLSLTLGKVAEGTLFGAKYTVWNGRDLYGRRGRKAIDSVQRELTRRVRASARLKDRIQRMLFQELGGAAGDDPLALAQFWLKYYGNMNALPLTREHLRRIDALIAGDIAAFGEYREQLNKAYDSIRNGPQFAFSCQILKNNNRMQAIFDYGLGNAVTWTWNASTADFRSVRGATEFKARLTPERSRQVTVSAAAETRWLTGLKPEYAVQGKLTVPISAGVNFPIVILYRNHRGPMVVTGGLTLDVGRLRQ